MASGSARNDGSGPGASPGLEGGPDHDRAPHLVVWEVTQSCEMACVHCRVDARPDPDPAELSTAEGKALLREIRRFGSVLCVLTGGDPLRRPDLFELVRYGDQQGLRMTLTPSATPRLTTAALRRLKQSGLQRVAIGLDDPVATEHDAFRGVPGSFRRTIESIIQARAIGLDVQVDTTITRRNHRRLIEMAVLLSTLDIALWSVFLLVPIGRADEGDVCTALEHEEVYQTLFDLAGSLPFELETSAGQPYRRVVAQRGGGRGGPGLAGRAPAAVNDGKGLVFVSHTGEIQPSGFLPLSAGSVRERRLVDVYRRDPLFRSLRDAGKLLGKCGVCEYRRTCGGSRSRSYALTGAALASDPTCLYEPGTGGRSSYDTAERLGAGSH